MSYSNRPSATPREVFLHLLGFGSLYISVVALIQLLFQYVNKWFPDVLNPGYSVANSVRWSVAVMVVFVPAMVWVARTVERDFTQDADRARVAIRRWLLHFTMFLAGITVLIDIATLAYNFLGGELTSRFILKVVAVLLVTAVVFWYMRADANREGKALPVRAQQVMWLSVGIVVIAMVGGVWLVGSPKTERLARLDDQREQDVLSVQSQVIEYWRVKGTLPSTLEVLNNPTGTWGIMPRDPETGALYEYELIADQPLSFRICATFVKEGVEDATLPSYPYPYGYTVETATATHTAGRVCFDRTIDPDFYPPYEQPTKR